MRTEHCRGEAVLERWQNGIALASKASARKGLGVRIPRPPLFERDCSIQILAEPGRLTRPESVTRRGGRVAEGSGLLNRRMVLNCTGGSNPPLSATNPQV